MIIIISILSSLVIIAGYSIWNLLAKVEKQEDAIEKQNKYIMSIYDIAKQSEKQWKEIDTLGAYKSDDEVGTFYEYLENFQALIKEYIIDQQNEK